MQRLLISKADLPFNVSPNTPDARVRDHITNAQMMDLRPLMGNNLYNDMLDTLLRYQAKDPKPVQPSAKEQLYLNLFNGYVYGKPATTFMGVKQVLIYYVYARLIMGNDLHVGAAGNNLKNNEYSDRPSFNLLKNTRDDAESLARGYWNDVESFLKTFGKFYEYYEQTSCSPKTKKKTSAVRYSGVGSLWNGSVKRTYTEPAQDYTPADNVTIYFDFFDVEPNPAVDVIAWRYSMQVERGSTEYVIEWPIEAVGKCLGFSEPVTEPIKDVYYVDAANMGTIPDQAWRDPVVVDDQRITISAEEFEMPESNTKINFSNYAI